MIIKCFLWKITSAVWCSQALQPPHLSIEILWVTGSFKVNRGLAEEVLVLGGIFFLGEFPPLYCSVIILARYLYCIANKLKGSMLTRTAQPRSVSLIYKNVSVARGSFCKLWVLLENQSIVNDWCENHFLACNICAVRGNFCIN